MSVKVINKDNKDEDRKEKGLADIEEYLREKLDYWLEVYQDAINENNLEAYEKAHGKLTRLSPLKKKAQTEYNEKPVYRMSAWLVRDAFKYLTRLPEESLCFVAGQQVRDNSYTLERLIKVDHEIQTSSRAKAQVNSSAQALSEIDDYGASFTAHLHSHPFAGEGGTRPSNKDFKFQSSLEGGGYVCIGGIFSRDGYLRFFSHQREFEVQVTGLGVSRAGENLFLLTEDD